MAVGEKTKKEIYTIIGLFFSSDQRQDLVKKFEKGILTPCEIMEVAICHILFVDNLTRDDRGVWGCPC